jgi:hypothetical protein
LLCSQNLLRVHDQRIADAVQTVLRLGTDANCESVELIVVSRLTGAGEVFDVFGDHLVNFTSEIGPDIARATHAMDMDRAVAAAARHLFVA